MLDSYNRKINYLRISVTDLCNLRCTYCMPAQGITQIPRSEILTFEEIYDFVKMAVSKGIDKIRLTGGEPLVRKDIARLIELIASIEGVKDLAMTTNGILLEKMAFALKNAGLMRVNISLDTLSPQKYAEITRGGDISKVLNGIEAAKSAGLNPVKINCVVFKSSGESDAKQVAQFCKENGLGIRFIHQMNLSSGEFSTVEGGEGGNCRICNRLRLTADGYLKPCLFSDIKYNIRQLGSEKALLLTLQNKPKRGTFALQTKFYNIGG